MATKFMDKAKREKADEFYTQLADIENELRYYKEQFKNKVVFCNCDDPFESNFFKYFALNFNHLKLKKLIATSYDSSPIAFTQLSMFDCGKTVSNKNRKAYKIEITEVSDYNTDGAIDLADVRYLLKNKQNTLTILDGDGDFRSEECVALLKQSNIVVTNPPFSLFREYVAQIIGAGKDFIMIGNTNALTYKEIFKLFKENKIRTGNTNFNVGMYFYVPDNYEKYHKIENNRKMVRVSTSCWFTSLPVKKHNEFLTLYKRYTPEEYTKSLNREFEGFNGKDTIFVLDAEEKASLTIKLSVTLDKGQFKALLVTNDNDIVILLESDGIYEQSFELEKGISRIIIVGDNSSGLCHISFSDVENVNIKNTSSGMDFDDWFDDWF